jgi:hypothetical protein
MSNSVSTPIPNLSLGIPLMSTASPHPMPRAVRKVGPFPPAVESDDHSVDVGAVLSCPPPRRHEDSHDIPLEQCPLLKEMGTQYLPVSQALPVSLVLRWLSQLFPVIGFREVS